MGYKLIRSAIAQGRTKVVSNQRLATDTEVQTDEIMYGGDRLVWQGVGLCSRREVSHGTTLIRAMTR